jgi:hypothetical protein
MFENFFIISITASLNLISNKIVFPSFPYRIKMILCSLLKILGDPHSNVEIVHEHVNSVLIIM